MSKHSILCSEAAIGNVVENQFKTAISKESVFSKSGFLIITSLNINKIFF